MMALVFSIASWRCAWHMIQGDSTKNIGIVDSEYIVHCGLPTLRGVVANKVRKRSYTELEIFKNRWKKAVKDDDSWIDTVQQSQNQKKH
ncbi:hypothetical protein Ddye_025556 [Dipteronia dyeriana]|uniref:Uncharacterized protein n=1 Tax=Dipteronia dyeriana TaxID=168575 RepID=A0AAD9TL31_9ROSI|nr:hypothetical protein Ddye_025556 [Dipteronia dyeriana]